MDLKYCASEISNIALSMFRKNFFGVFHGSISARILHDSFLINKRTTIFDNLKEEDLIMSEMYFGQSGDSCFLLPAPYPWPERNWLLPRHEQDRSRFLFEKGNEQ